MDPVRQCDPLVHQPISVLGQHLEIGSLRVIGQTGSKDDSRAITTASSG